MSSIETEIELEGMLFMSSASGGEVNDVKVDGVSVVSNGIANIDLSDKQDKLTAGDNITIDKNGVISATGGGGGTVDQSFNPTSTNAQSGVAVHQAVSPAIGYANAALSMLGDVPEDTDVQSEIDDLDERVTYLEEHGGGSGAVDDVKVDGVSVVSSGIANIDLSGKANASDVYTKQEVNTRLQTKAPLSDVNILFDTIGNVPETTTVQAEIEQKSDKTTIITSSDTTATVELLNNSEYRYINALSNFTITFPAEIPNDYITSVMFYSIGVPTNLTYPSGIKWSGDDIVSGEFVPASGKKYTLCLWYDGVLNGVVRGVPNE